MDKYRANETVNDINLRGIDLVHQVSMGQNPSLAGWEKTSRAGYTFSDAQLSAEGDAYFTLSGVPKRVCELVYAGIQNNQTTDVEVNEATNGDATDCNKDENTMGFFFITNAGEGGKTLEDLCKDKTCPEGYSCAHGICMSDELPEVVSQYIVCKSSDDKVCGECSVCNNNWAGLVCLPTDDGTPCSNGTCYQGDCVPSECSKNEDCLPYGSGYYGADTNKSATEAHPKYCKKSNFTKKTINLYDGSKETYYISNNSLSWWDAMSACEALNASPITDELWMQWVTSECSSPNSWTTTCQATGRVDQIVNFPNMTEAFWLQGASDVGNYTYTYVSNHDVYGRDKNYWGDSGPIKALCYTRDMP